MKSLKTICPLLLSLLLASFSLPAQNLLSYIPADATMIMSFDPTSVNAKVEVNALKQLEFCKVMMEELAKGLNAEEAGVISDALNNPGQYGMDLNTKSFFFMQVDEEGTYFSYVFRLSNPTTFADFFNAKLFNAEQGLRVENKNGMTIATVDDSAISWNEEVAMFTSATITRKYSEFNWDTDYGDDDAEDYEDVTIEEKVPEEKVVEEEPEENLNIKPSENGEEEIEEVDEDWSVEELDGGETDEEYALRKAAALNGFTKHLFAIPVDSTIHSHGKFMTHLQKRNDVSVWLDYQFITQMGMEDIPGMNPGVEAFLGAYKNMYQDAHLSMSMNFDPGVIEIDTDVQMGEAWMNYMRSAVDAKINRKFCKYLKGENLLGYMFFNYNMENVLKGGKDLMLPAMESIPMAGPMMDDALGILDIIVDEEAIYEFFKGDFCLAFTGMREFENMVTTYEFDEEFNAIEKEELKKQTLPEFVMMMSYGNEENLNKFFRLGEKLGGLQKKGAYYEVPAATGSLGMNMYAAAHKGILFFTNDTDLVEKNLSGGFPGKKRIDKKHRKMMKSNAQVMFWDVPKSINSASELGIPFGLSGDQIVNVSKQSLESVIITAPKNIGTSYGSNMSFRFANKQMNALEQLFNFINEIYLMEKGSQSM